MQTGILQDIVFLDLISFGCTCVSGVVTRVITIAHPIQYGLKTNQNQNTWGSACGGINSKLTLCNTVQYKPHKQYAHTTVSQGD